MHASENAGFVAAKDVLLYLKMQVACIIFQKMTDVGCVSIKKLFYLCGRHSRDNDICLLKQFF